MCSLIAFINHTGEYCPVNETDWVIYKTITKENGTIRTHLPALASCLNWRKNENCLQYIHSYAVVKKPIFPKFKPMYTKKESAQVKAIQEQIKNSHDAALTLSA